MKNIDLKVKKGQFICIVGKNGCGKSSILNAVNGEMIFIDQLYLDEANEKERSQEYFDEALKTIARAEITCNPV